MQMGFPCDPERLLISPSERDSAHLAPPQEAATISIYDLFKASDSSCEGRKRKDRDAIQERNQRPENKFSIKLFHDRKFISVNLESHSNVMQPRHIFIILGRNILIISNIIDL